MPVRTAQASRVLSRAGLRRECEISGGPASGSFLEVITSWDVGLGPGVLMLGFARKASSRQGFRAAG